MDRVAECLALKKLKLFRRCRGMARPKKQSPGGYRQEPFMHVDRVLRMNQAAYYYIAN